VISLVFSPRSLELLMKVGFKDGGMDDGLYAGDGWILTGGEQREY
jgi:hypothetical protein